jgi:cation:H+ antiporter
MEIGLVAAILIFLAAAVVVGGAGVALVSAGDELAEYRGWSRVFVGTMLIAVGTSLPELATNISAVSFDAPALAIGDIFGADMADVMILGLIAAAYGRLRFFAELSRETRSLAVLALTLVGAALLFSVLPWGARIGKLGVGAGLVSVLYVAGAWRLSRGRAADVSTEPSTKEAPVFAHSERRDWMVLLGAGAFILVAAPIATASAERIAELTGLASGFVGIAMLALVTTLPEAVTSIAALKLGSPDLVVGNLLGSCAFNIFVLGVADAFYTQGLLLNVVEGPHYAAGGAALLMIAMVWGRMLLGDRWVGQRVPVFPILLAIVYGSGLTLAFFLGD